MSIFIDHWQLIAALIGAGAFAGIIAGLFGVGGGVVIVPALYAAFGILDVDDAVRMKAAVATSLATIITTSIRSAWLHYKRGAVDVRILKLWAPWIMAGALVGSFAASAAPGEALTMGFAIFLILLSVQMGFGQPDWRLRETMPPKGPSAVIAAFVGLFSAMAGIGGGIFGVIIMTLCGKPIHRAVGTAAGFGAAIGIPATLGFILAGWNVPNLPVFSFGYVNVTGFIFIASLTALMAPVGVALAHALPVKHLRRLFAVLMVVAGGLMLRDVLG
ncbi:MAG: sulfite exporter TauE/SafE family protein [Robiginitomaculum sp.]|nr:sulfite exporter TauE/SafE family protein [Robiginitomaculum sp.]MDQ7078269.1 sulfite exporter TauE/SafE family protein [Robiginitomaculum sp.]